MYHETKLSSFNADDGYFIEYHLLIASMHYLTRVNQCRGRHALLSDFINYSKAEAVSFSWCIRRRRIR